MDDFFLDGPLGGENDSVLFAGFPMADSQISDSGFSSDDPEPITRKPSLPAAPTPFVESRKPWRRRQSLEAGRRESRHQEAVEGLSESWESDADFVGERQAARPSDGSSQDLLERISNLTQTINANAAFCLEVSSKMIELARENKHLFDASKTTLETYVLQPCLKIPGMLKTYYPGIQDGLQEGLEMLKEYESQLRRTVRNSANGRDMARAQGVAGGDGGSRREMTRLKDRLVEQDALLRDSSQHVQKLIREREALKKELHAKRTQTQADIDVLGLDMSSGQILETDPDGIGTDTEQHPVPDTSENDFSSLADHLREMRVLMDRLELHEASNHDRRKPITNKDDFPGEEPAADDEDAEWTLL